MLESSALLQPQIAIVGGSGLYSILEKHKTQWITTPFGVSAPIELGEISGKEYLKDFLITIEKNPNDKNLCCVVSNIIANFADRSMIPMFIGLMKSPHPDVRYSGIKALRNVTGEFFGFNPYKGKKHREKAIKKWQDWWEIFTIMN